LNREIREFVCFLTRISLSLSLSSIRTRKNFDALTIELSTL
jgi:hypothetical protein